MKRQLSASELADESQLALAALFAPERGQGIILLEDLDRLARALGVNVGGVSEGLIL